MHFCTVQSQCPGSPGHSRCSHGNLRPWWPLQSTPVRNLGDRAHAHWSYAHQELLLAVRTYVMRPCSRATSSRHSPAVVQDPRPSIRPFSRNAAAWILTLSYWADHAAVWLNITPVWSSHITTSSCPAILRQKWLKQCTDNKLVLDETYLPSLR